jgi:hypothetical protein
VSYKYHTAAEYHQMILESEAEADRRAALQADQDRLDQVKRWCEDKNNAAQLAEIRAEFARIDAQQAPSAAPAAPAPRFAPGTPQNPIPANARFSASDLAYDRPAPARIVDPKV